MFVVIHCGYATHCCDHESLLVLSARFPALEIDVFPGQVVSKGTDMTAAQPLWHAVMVAIDAAAADNRRIFSCTTPGNSTASSTGTIALCKCELELSARLPGKQGAKLFKLPHVELQIMHIAI